MRIIYISGPYCSKWRFFGVLVNILKARWVAIKLWKMGYMAFCPHMCTAFYPKERQIDYIKGDLELISRLHSGRDSLVMLPNWEKSEGAKEEKTFAEFHGLKIWYWPEDKERIRKNA